MDLVDDYPMMVSHSTNHAMHSSIYRHSYLGHIRCGHSLFCTFTVMGINCFV